MNVEEIKEECNELSLEDLQEIIMFCSDLADSLEAEQNEINNQ